MILNEHQEQKILIRWFRLQYPQYIIFAIPNGGMRNKITAMKLKDEGVLSGVSDLFLMCANQSYNGLFVEMKSIKGKLSVEQNKFMLAANRAGYKAIVCFGFTEAQTAINNYLHDRDI
jgi:hypothetical protein